MGGKSIEVWSPRDLRQSQRSHGNFVPMIAVAFGKIRTISLNSWSLKPENVSRHVGMLGIERC
jgi:hypothetical protein